MGSDLMRGATCSLWILSFSLSSAVAVDFRELETFEEQIEYYATISRIRVEQLLVVDITGTLTRLSIRSPTPLLLGDSMHSLALNNFRKIKRRYFSLEVFDDFRKGTVGPWYLNALAAPQFIAIVSDTLPEKENRENDFYQNIRHKCIVHFFYGDVKYQIVELIPLYGIPLLHFSTYKSSFWCNRKNAVVSWIELDLIDKPQECANAESVEVEINGFSRHSTIILSIGYILKAGS